MDHEKNNRADGSDSKPNRRGKMKSKSSTLRQTSLDFRKYTQQIWLAGLGAFSKVGEEGNKLFDNLVKMGEELESTTEQVVDQHSNQAEKSKSNVDSSHKSKVDQLLDHRLRHSLSRLGLVTTQDLNRLENLILQLQDKVDLLIEENQELKTELKKNQLS